MIRKILFLSLLCALSMGQEALYLSDFHYAEDEKNKKILQDNEIADRVYMALDKLTSQNKSGLISLKNANFVAIYTTKQDALKNASELMKYGYNDFILAKDDLGNNLLLLNYQNGDDARFVARKLLDNGLDAKAILNNQRLFYYDTYFVKNAQISHDKIQTVMVQEPVNTYSQPKTYTKKPVKSKAKNNSLNCNIIAKMRNKTFFNPQTNIFVINGVEYKELPKEFIDCGISFTDVKLTNSKVVSFTTDENKTISGKLIMPNDVMDDNFFYKPQSAEVVKQKMEIKKVICDFTLPNGIRTALDENMQTIKLPQTYSGNEIELFYDVLKNSVKLSNSGYANILITKDNFKNHCKKVAQ